MENLQSSLEHSPQSFPVLQRSSPVLTKAFGFVTQGCVGSNPAFVRANKSTGMATGLHYISAHFFSKALVLPTLMPRHCMKMRCLFTMNLMLFPLANPLCQWHILREAKPFSPLYQSLLALVLKFLPYVAVFKNSWKNF